MINRALAVAGTMSIAAMAIADGILATSQIRSIGAEAWALPCDDVPVTAGQNAAGFRPFDEVADAVLVCDDGGAIAHSSQTSTIDPLRLEAAGSTYAETQLVEFTFLMAISDSGYQVEFDLEVPARVHVAGSLAGSAVVERWASHWVIASSRLTQDLDVLLEDSVQPQLGELLSLDVDGDGDVDVEDLLAIVGAWGATEPGV